MPKESADFRRRTEQARRTTLFLREHYGDAECALIHDSPLQLLIATILSAQCTDERVNQVTPPLFSRFPTAEALASASLEELEALVRTTGFFRNKAKNIRDCCRALVERHGGQVPRTLDELVVLAGVGRKTANVVLGTAYGIPSGVVVDTHVSRLTRRLGITAETTPEKIEADLMRLVPQADWIDFSHRLIHHGRRICNARKPLCAACGLAPHCPKVDV